MSSFHRDSDSVPGSHLGTLVGGWEDFAPYVKKFHTATGPSEKTRNYLKGLTWSASDQGTTGPVQISFGEDYYLPYHAAWLETFKNLGFELTEDPIKGGGVGAFISPGTIDPVTHTRSHAGVAYYPPSVQQRPNLRVVTNAHVEKVILQSDDELVSATGVQVLFSGKRYTIPANKEVIMAAGASQTPQLLELSGIGDAGLLQSFGVPVIIDNKGVGENLQDHANVSFAYEVAEGMPSADKSREPEFKAWAMGMYKAGRGLLTMMPCVPAFMPHPDFSNEDLAALVSKIRDPMQEAKVPGLRRQYREIQQLLSKNQPSCQYILSPGQISARAGPGPKDIYGTKYPGYFISITAILSHPLSRGSVHMQSVGPQAPPMIDHGILRHPADLELLARRAMWMDKIPQAEPLASMLKKGGKRLHDPEPVTDLEKAQKLMKELAIPMFHSCGVCSMMPREDGGVVSPRLKVYGTRNLRVVDASIFPIIVRGNIQVTVYAVAEKAADLIKEDHKGSSM